MQHLNDAARIEKKTHHAIVMVTGFVQFIGPWAGRLCPDAQVFPILAMLDHMVLLHERFCRLDHCLTNATAKLDADAANARETGTASE